MKRDIFNLTVLCIGVVSIACITIFGLKYSTEKWDYSIELINQNSARINNGKETKIIAFDSIQSYITKDNE